MTRSEPDSRPPFDIGAILAEREPERYGLHTAHMNEQMVRVLQTIGYDVGFRAGQGQYLFDRKGDRYLDLLSGWGVFAIGRNHPVLRDALKAVLGSDLPNLIQMDVSVLSGVLAERLLAYTPWLDKVFFANSGAEAVEAAIKFARCTTGRADIAYADHAFHGLSYGALSLTGDRMFRDGLRHAAAGLRRGPIQRSRRARARTLVDEAGRGLHRRADPGQGGQHPRRRLSRRACRRSAASTVPCSSPTRSRQGSAAPASSWRSSTGASSRTWC